jgi:hypothetical protein
MRILTRLVEVVIDDWVPTFAEYLLWFVFFLGGTLVALFFSVGGPNIGRANFAQVAVAIAAGWGIAFGMTGGRVFPHKFDRWWRDRKPASAGTKQKSGIIPAWGPKRVWFSAGVILGGVGLAAALTPEIGAGRGITAGLISPITFLLAFDRVGDFKVVRAIPAILFAATVAIVLKIPVVGGFFGFIGFMIVGWLAVGVGAIVSAITGQGRGHSQ